MPSLHHDSLTRRMESLIQKYEARSRVAPSPSEPPELTEALGVSAHSQERPLPIPDRVLKEMVSKHIERATDAIMMSFDEAIDRMTQDVRNTLDEHLQKSHLEVRERLQSRLLEITRTAHSSE